MQTADLEPIPWTACAFLSVAQAARIVARSPDWIRNQVGEGRLEGVRLNAGGPLVVAVPSLQRLVRDAQPVAPIEMSMRRPTRSKPRLVVSNA